MSYGHDSLGKSDAFHHDSPSPTTDEGSYHKRYESAGYTDSLHEDALQSADHHVTKQSSDRQRPALLGSHSELRKSYQESFSQPRTLYPKSLDPVPQHDAISFHGSQSWYPTPDQTAPPYRECDSGSMRTSCSETFGQEHWHNSSYGRDFDWEMYQSQGKERGESGVHRHTAFTKEDHRLGRHHNGGWDHTLYHNADAKTCRRRGDG